MGAPDLVSVSLTTSVRPAWCDVVSRKEAHWQNNLPGGAPPTRVQTSYELSATDVVRAAENDMVAHMNLPKERWTQIYSTNRLERVNK